MGQTGRTNPVVAEDTERFAVEVVGSAFRDHVDRAGRSPFIGKIEVRLGDREFLNRTGRNVERGGADRLVGDVDAVHFNAGGAAESTAEGNRGGTALGRIEGRAILDLNTRLKLGKIEEVAPIDRQIFDLGGVQNTLNLGLLCIYT